MPHSPPHFFEPTHLPLRSSPVVTAVQGAQPNITGLQDQIFRNDKIIAEMLTQFQNIKSIEYKDAGHMIPVEIPEQLAKDILKFIERL